MLKHDSMYRETAALRVTPARTARLTLAIALLAGTTTAIAQDAGLSAYADDMVDRFDEAVDSIDSPASRPSSDMNFDVTVSEYDLVDLHVNNEDLGRVLQLLSIQSQRNIITSSAVETSVTADLYGVTFYEALDAILHVNGYGYIEKGNFIYVYTREELAAIEQAARTRESRVFRLNYLSGFDASAFTNSLLSEGGKITANGATEEFTLNGDAPSGADNFAAGSTLVVWDYPENLDAIAALIAEIDTKPVQVLVEATILQTTLNEANAFGVDFAIINDMDFMDFIGTGGPLTAVNGLITGAGETIAGTAVPATGLDGRGQGVGTNVANIDGPATLKAGIVNEDVAIFLRVLDQVTDVTVVSNPKILTLNRQAARVLVGTKVGYLNTTTTETATTQSVEFLDTGTQLSVRPFVSDSGLIRLELKPQVSSAQLREVSDNTGNTVTIPDEDTTELTTNIMLQDGQTAVLGGLFTEITTATRRQVPLLGDIPLIGNAFRGHDDSTRRNEIIFLVTPSLVNDAILNAQGELASVYTENARMGARKGTLPFSRDRRVGRLLIEARKHADNGEHDMAIYKVQKALALAPTSADARVLLEHLSNDKKRTPSRSLMEGMINRELLEPMPGVTADPRLFDSRYVPKPEAKPSAEHSTAATTQPPIARQTPPAVATTPAPARTDGFIVEDLDSAAGFEAQAPSEPVDVTQAETGGMISSEQPTTDAWTAPAAPSTVVTVEPAESFDLESFEFDSFDTAGDAGTHQGVISSEEEYAWSQPAAAAAPASGSFITIEDLPASGQWAWPQTTTGTATRSAPAAVTTPSTTAPAPTPAVSQAPSAPVQIVDADGWAFAGPEALGDDAFIDHDDFYDDDADWMEFADEQSGDRDPVITIEDAPAADALAREYSLSPKPAAPSSKGFDRPAEDILSMITTPSRDVPVSKAPATSGSTGRVAPTSTVPTSARRGGYLVVPLPTGGVVQIPWPEHQSVDGEGVRWREFTSVPVDRVDTNAFDTLDR